LNPRFSPRELNELLSVALKRFSNLGLIVVVVAREIIFL
jgi:hypothetical protein